MLVKKVGELLPTDRVGYLEPEQSIGLGLALAQFCDGFVDNRRDGVVVAAELLDALGCEIGFASHARGRTCAGYD